MTKLVWHMHNINDNKYEQKKMFWEKDLQRGNPNWPSVRGNNKSTTTTEKVDVLSVWLNSYALLLCVTPFPQECEKVKWFESPTTNAFDRNYKAAQRFDKPK